MKTIDNETLIAALETIDEAVGIYDDEDRLIAFNPRYAEWRSAMAGNVQKGARWDDLVQASVRDGKIPEAIGREEEWLRERRRLRGAYSIVRRLPDGRAFKVNERRMPNGGIAVLWTDISDLVQAQEETEALLQNYKEVNQKLFAEIEERKRAQEALTQLRETLERRVTERTADLEKTLAERDLLLREVYHRVKNNLQIIDSMLVLQSRKIADPQTADGLLGLRDRVHALGLVHQQLMGSPDLQTFNVATFLEELTTNLLESVAPENTTVSVEAAPVQIGLDVAIPLGLVVAELVTNSLKHAFPHGGGKVVISLHESYDGEIVLIVADDGQGQDRHHEGADIAKEGLGSGIIRGLVAQLGGTMRVSHEGGTRTEIRIAVSEVG